MRNASSVTESQESQAVLNQIVMEHLREQAHQRFWRKVRWGVLLVALVWMGYEYVYHQNEYVSAKLKPHVGLIDVEGEISSNQSANADQLMKGLEKAYEQDTMKALILRINSPGGSPVQADYMYNTIKFYRQKHPDVKIYAVCVDLCASAAYYVAAAADEIYANPASMVGSIGVVYNGFGFVDALQKLGVTRRLQTAGQNKGFMDQFSPENPTQKEALQTMLDLIHEQFISQVKLGRGNRLHVNDDTFSGLIWTGRQAKEQGLIDGFASSGQLARDIIKIDKIVDYTTKPSVLEQMATNVGAAIVHQVPEALGVKPGFY